MEPVKAPDRGQGLLLDTNVLIDLLRGEKLALDWLDHHGAGAAISMITWIEVMVGCRPSESATVRNWLEGFRRLDLDQAVAQETVICRQARGLKVPDAIILATARCHHLILVTRNSRDFPPKQGQVICPYHLP